MLDGVAGDAAQPVVGMYGLERHIVIGTEPSGCRHRLEDPVGELVDHVDQRFLLQRSWRAGSYVVHSEARFDVHGGRQIVRRGPGVDVALHAGPSQGG